MKRVTVTVQALGDTIRVLLQELDDANNPIRSAQWETRSKEVVKELVEKYI